MIALQGFKILDQLHSMPAPSDGRPDENAAYNCVPTSLAMCVRYFTGQQVAPDDWKDLVYGQGHVGGGAELSYGKLMADRYHLRLGFEPLPSASQQIIDRIRANLRVMVPVIVTMHSAWSTPWARAAGGGLHVGVAWAISETDGGVLHIANPWHGFDHVQPVSWWRDRLGIGVWPVSRMVVTPAGLPPSWSDDGTTLIAPNGVAVVRGFREYVIEKAAEGLWLGGMPYVSEYNDSGDGSVQPFVGTLLLWNPRQGVYEGTLRDATRIVAHEHQGKAA